MSGRRARLPFVLVFAAACALLAARPASAQKVVIPDRTYGEGGSREIEIKKDPNGADVTEVTVKDKNGKIREHHVRTENPKKHNAVAETHEWFDENETKNREAWIDFDVTGKTIYWHEHGYDGKGNMNSGTVHRQGLGGKFEDLRWNDDRKTWEKIVPEPKNPKPPKNLPKFPKDARPFNFWGWFDSDVTSGLYLGGDFIVEHAVNRFMTLGVDASYTHATSSTWGLMADVQWTRGTSDDVTYTKLQAMGGIAMRHRVRGGFYLAPHALAGVATVSSDYGQSIPTSTTSAFALAVGVDFGQRISGTMDAQGRVDYNPTIQSGGMRHNVRLSAGLRIRF